MGFHRSPFSLLLSGTVLSSSQRHNNALGHAPRATLFLGRSGNQLSLGKILPFRVGLRFRSWEETLWGVGEGTNKTKIPDRISQQKSWGGYARTSDLLSEDGGVPFLGPSVPHFQR